MIEKTEQRIDQIRERYQKLKTYLFMIEKNNNTDAPLIQSTIYEIIYVALELNKALEDRYQETLQEINERPAESIYESQQKMDEIIELNNRRREELESIPELGMTASHNIERLRAINDNLSERRTLITANEILEEKRNDLQNMTDDFALLSDELEEELDNEILHMYSSFGLNDLTSTEIHEDVNMEKFNMRISDSNYVIKESSSNAFSPEERREIRSLSYDELDARMRFYEAREKQILLYIKELSEMPMESMDFLAEKRLVMLDYLNERKKMRIDLGLQGQEDKLASLEELITSQLVKFNAFKDRQNLIRIYNNQVEKNTSQIKKLETILQGLGIQELYDRVLENNRTLKLVENNNIEEIVLNNSISINKVIKLYYEENDNSIRIGIFENNELVTSLPGNYQGKDRKTIIESLKQYQRLQEYNDYSFEFRFPKEYQENIILKPEEYSVKEDKVPEVIELGPGKEIVLSSEKGLEKQKSLKPVIDRDGPIFTDEERFEKGYEYLTKENAQSLNKLKGLDKKEDKSLNKEPIVSIRTIPEKVRNFFRQNKKKIAAGLISLAATVGSIVNIAHAPVLKKEEIEKNPVPTPIPAIERSIEEDKIEDEYEEALEAIDNIDFDLKNTPSPTSNTKPNVSVSPKETPEIVKIVEKEDTTPVPQEPVMTPEDEKNVDTEIPVPTPEPTPTSVPEPEVPIIIEPTPDVETPFVNESIPNVLVPDENGNLQEIPTQEFLQASASAEELQAPKRR